MVPGLRLKVLTNVINLFGNAGPKIAKNDIGFSNFDNKMEYIL